MFGTPDLKPGADCPQDFKRHTHGNSTVINSSSTKDSILPPDMEEDIPPPGSTEFPGDPTVVKSVPSSPSLSAVTLDPTQIDALSLDLLKSADSLNLADSDDVIMTEDNTNGYDNNSISTLGSKKRSLSVRGDSDKDESHLDGKKTRQNPTIKQTSNSHTKPTDPMKVISSQLPSDEHLSAQQQQELLETQKLQETNTQDALKNLLPQQHLQQNKDSMDIDANQNSTNGANINSQVITNEAGIVKNNSDNRRKPRPAIEQKYTTDNQGPYVLLAEPIDADLLSGKLHPSTVGKLLCSKYKGKIHSIDSSGAKKVTITLKDGETAN